MTTWTTWNGSLWGAEIPFTIKSNHQITLLLTEYSTLRPRWIRNCQRLTESPQFLLLSSVEFRLSMPLSRLTQHRELLPIGIRGSHWSATWQNMLSGEFGFSGRASPLFLKLISFPLCRPLSLVRSHFLTLPLVCKNVDYWNKSTFFACSRIHAELKYNSDQFIQVSRLSVCTPKVSSKRGFQKL